MLSRILQRVKTVGASSPFLRHVLTLVTGTAVSQVVVFFMMMIITRLYGREVLGELGTFNSIVAIAVTIAAGRYDMALMLEKDDRNAKVLAQLALRLIVLTSLACTIIAFPLQSVVASYYSPDVARWMPLAGLTTFFLAGAVLLQYWFNRRTDYKTIAMNRVQQQISATGGQIAFGAVGVNTLPGLVTGQILGQASAFFNLGWRAKDLRRLDTTGSDSMSKLARKHWKMPVLNGPNALIDALRLNGINLLIGRVSIGDFGEYNLANLVVNVPVSLINSAVSQVFFQKLSTIEPGFMLAEVKRSIVRAIAIGFVPFAALYILSPWLFPLLFGSEWQQAGYFAQALIPWMLMTLITSPISNMFIVTGTQHLLLAFAVVYATAPLGWLYFSNLPLLETVFWLGVLMAASLTLMTLMSLYAAWRFDRRGVRVTEGIDPNFVG